MTTILIVGQTPPPFGGQAVMIQQIIDASFPGFELVHVRMAFSAEMSDIGTFQSGKLVELGSVVWRIVKARIGKRPTILYYPPAAPGMAPFLRDVVILCLARPLFRKTLFHFHASGLGEFYDRLTPILRPIFHLAYGKPDMAVRLSESTPDDAGFVRAKMAEIVPYGLDDHAAAFDPGTRGGAVPRILFVGLLKRSKGVMTLLEALGLLATEGVPFTAELVGQFESDGMRAEATGAVERMGLAGRVTFPGVRLGPEKWESFARADLFCFPSVFEAEAFPVVLLEAMMFSLPIVATRWRGIPSMVEDGLNGRLVPPEDPAAVADAMKFFLGDGARRREFGSAGRKRFLAEFTRARFEERMLAVFERLAKQL